MTCRMFGRLRWDDARESGICAPLFWCVRDVPMPVPATADDILCQTPPLTISRHRVEAETILST